MLTENEVISAVRVHLENHAYAIESTASTSQRGVDIVAKKKSSRRRVYVEAKGETTSKKTARAGKCFSRAQCRTHLAVAVLTAMRLRDSKLLPRSRVSAIALPDVPPHRELGEARSSMSQRSRNRGLLGVERRESATRRFVAALGWDFSATPIIRNGPLTSGCGVRITWRRAHICQKPPVILGTGHRL